jgi:hypothetical protein
MKATNYLIMLLTVGVLGLAGCSKSEQGPPPRQPGRVDLSQLQQAFPNPTPEVSACIEKIRFACRYRTFDPVQAELDKLANMPNLTEPQKKALNDVVEQVKTAINLNTTAKPGQ